MAACSHGEAYVSVCTGGRNPNWEGHRAGAVYKEMFLSDTDMAGLAFLQCCERFNHVNGVFSPQVVGNLTGEGLAAGAVDKEMFASDTDMPGLQYWS